MKLAGREITVEQKPFVEADIVSAKTILTRLQSLLPTSVISSCCVAPRVSEEL